MVVPVILALEPIIVPCAFFLCAAALVCCCCGVDRLRRCCNCTGDAEDTSRCVGASSTRDADGPSGCARACRDGTRAPASASERSSRLATWWDGTRESWAPKRSASSRRTQGVTVDVVRERMMARVGRLPQGAQHAELGALSQPQCVELAGGASRPRAPRGWWPARAPFGWRRCTEAGTEGLAQPPV